MYIKWRTLPPSCQNIQHTTQTITLILWPQSYIDKTRNKHQNETVKTDRRGNPKLHSLPSCWYLYFGWWLSYLYFVVTGPERERTAVTMTESGECLGMERSHGWYSVSLLYPASGPGITDSDVMFTPSLSCWVWTKIRINSSWTRSNLQTHKH